MPKKADFYSHYRMVTLKLGQGWKNKAMCRNKETWPRVSLYFIQLIFNLPKEIMGLDGLSYFQLDVHYF